MSLLQIMPDDAPETVLVRTEDFAEIARELAAVGVDFERWSPEADEVNPDGTPDEVLDAYRKQIDELAETGGYKLIDVARLRPDDDDPEWPAKAAKARQTFLEEHKHAEDEVRLFVAGSGCFYLHLDGKVYAMVCTAGDLLSVPEGTTHWFDMGPRPDFVAVRFFQEEDGWVGDFTGNPIAQRFPRLDALVA